MSANLYRKWLEIAAEDLVVARLVLREEHYSHACFLAQQSIEKALKAHLIAQTNDHPRVHNLVDLLGRCTQFQPDLTQFAVACASVDQFYIPTRYPSAIPGSLAAGPPSLQQAKAAVEWAQAILEYVRAQLA